MLWSQPRELCLDLKALKEINLTSPHNAFLNEKT